jgi:hypothetical protein
MILLIWYNVCLFIIKEPNHSNNFPVASCCCCYCYCSTIWYQKESMYNHIRKYKSWNWTNNGHSRVQSRTNAKWMEMINKKKLFFSCLLLFCFISSFTSLLLQILNRVTFRFLCCCCFCLYKLLPIVVISNTVTINILLEKNNEIQILNLIVT